MMIQVVSSDFTIDRNVGQNYEKYRNYNNLELSFNLFPAIFKWASKTAIPAVSLG